MVNLSTVSPEHVVHIFVMSCITLVVRADGFAVGGLSATAEVFFENVMCPRNATGASDCTFVSPPQSPRCLIGNLSAAGVSCVQGSSKTNQTLMSVFGFSFDVIVIQYMCFGL